ncbi:MAG TPA: host attachment protein [Stellaceae bacterium]|nr:host attachment protein [Stellaceae bacterium]
MRCVKARRPAFAKDAVVFVKETPMPKKRITWIVMADGSRARIVVRRQEAPGFEVVSEWASPEARVPSREIWSDRPGRTQESANTAHHGIGHSHDPHEERKAAFSRDLAERLNRAAEEKRFDALILFAPARCLGELRGTLAEAARARIKGEAPKDLTKLPLEQLPRHLDALAEG